MTNLLIPLRASRIVRSHASPLKCYKMVHMASVSAGTDFEKNDKNDNGDKPVKMAQLSPDAGPTIIQHEAIIMYNSVNKKVRDVIDFLHEALLAYTKGGSKLLKE
ncbi:hypothetical protein PV328_001089 [Microctonus aethiopoides]|uniref:Uncharacterized protein n=1 Tax=Microctonus aethiopoides TaxID=144406 RepID=A0AA39KX41_9HYME|nr:hypothetical protein PV328_001089 [Microctonus aethiopoides]